MEQISFTTEWLYLCFLHWLDRWGFCSSSCVSTRMIVLNHQACGETSRCFYWISIVLLRSQMAFRAKGCLQWEEVVICFLKAIPLSFALGVNWLDWDMLWGWVPHAGRRGILSEKVGFSARSVSVVFPWVSCRTLVVSRAWVWCMSPGIWKGLGRAQLMLTGITSRQDCLCGSPASLIWRKASSQMEKCHLTAWTTRGKHAGGRYVKMIL